MSEWITWSPCSVSCGEGVRSRERYVKQFPDDGFACTHSTEETEPCTVNDDCCGYFVEHTIKLLRRVACAILLKGLRC